MNAVFVKLYQLILKGNYDVTPSSPTCYEFAYYKSGTGIVKIGERNYKFSPGTFAVIAPNQMKDEVVTSDTELISLHFVMEGESNLLPSGLYYDTDRQVLKYFEKLQREYNDAKMYQDIFMNIICMELYYTVMRSVGESGDMEKDKIRDVVAYIDEYYNEDLSVEELAGMSGYSARHFRLLFVKETGLSPLDYIIRKRIDSAKQQLSQTSASIVTIAQLCHFSSSSQFSQIFRRDTGMTPKQYRQKMRQEGGGESG